MSTGLKFSSVNPATSEIVWTGPAAAPFEVDAAVRRSRLIFRSWSRTTLAERQGCVQAFARVLAVHKERIAGAISREIGKPAWEALSEVQTMITKVEFSIKAQAQRCADFSAGPAVTRFRPHGVVAVFGPFNFPGHLPNGHIVPALLAGNTVIFKPSEHAPLVAELTEMAWREAGLPDGVLKVVQGGRETGAALARHPDIDGLFFTGSNRTGLWLSELFAKTPGKILALELGGNNPLILWNARDLRAAAVLTAQSAFLSAGQRCTCARRLILPAGPEGDAFLAEFVQLAGHIKVGPYTDRPEPFMGPVVSSWAAMGVLSAQEDLIAAGGRSLLKMKLLWENTGLLSPGVMDVTNVKDRVDEEIFGPLLQVIRVPDFNAALSEANATRYGLAAGLISDDGHLYNKFRDEIRAGVVNWNQQTTGASGAAPFGGAGHSGNHRPSGFFAADYCAYPVASMEIPELKMPAQLPPGLVA